jgi:RHS repeat-associated protein
VINDTFTAADGTPLTSLGWTAAVGSFQVQNNQAVPLSGASNDQAVRDAGAADVILSCDVTPTGTWPDERDPDLLVRWSDATHYWLLHLTAGVGVIQLYENAGSGLTLRVNQGYAFTSGNSYHVTVAAIGTTISVSINGVLQFSYSGAASNRNATGVGLWLGISGSTTPCSWDNFQVTALPRLWVQQDANWDVTAVTDNTGAVVERYVYSPYGNVSAFDASWNVRSGGSAFGWVYLHQGLRYDPALITYDARGRAYHPDLMRFLQNDPLGFAAGDVDLYRAEGDNPTDRVDPSGLADPLDLLTAAGLGGVVNWPGWLWAGSRGAYPENPRTLGMMQAVGGGLETFLGVWLFPGTLGWSSYMVLHGLDNLATGTRVTITAEPEPTLTEMMYGKSIDDAMNNIFMIAGIGYAWQKMFGRDNVPCEAVSEPSASTGQVGRYTTKIQWGVLEIEARPAGPGYWGKRVPQGPRVDAYELKINPNNESYYLPHPEGGYVQFENFTGTSLEDGKLTVTADSSLYRVNDRPAFAQELVMKTARRQIEAASPHGLQVEWLAADEEATAQLTALFKEKGINIKVTHLPE